MTIEQVRNFYNARPFVPFVMHLADGREVFVGYPEYLASAPNGRTVTVYQPDSTLNVVDLLLVTDLEVKPAANGRGKKRKN
jgi:hypothetical protein